ncbi:MAG: 50S ribosomal protein L25 [Anaerolineaceae bacterium]|nr:50S ribosomal protein L25 [Anaerolineaceae bacterium]
MEQLVINAEKRNTTGKKVNALRRAGKLPGVIYGHKVDPTPVIMDQKETTLVLNQATSSSIVVIKLDGKDISALIREKQKDFIRNSYLHIDFQAVSLTEIIRTAVNIELIGTAPAVKDYNGVIVEGLTSIEVEALPNDLPERFTIDISSLAEIGNSILVKDIVVSDKVTVLTPLEELVILVSSPAGEEVVAEGAENEPELINKGKEEEQED